MIPDKANFQITSCLMLEDWRATEDGQTLGRVVTGGAGVIWPRSAEAVATPLPDNCLNYGLVCKHSELQHTHTQYLFCIYTRGGGAIL